ncbi:MLIP protein, partial [Polyodon spathula]|nr:MLIP protein [Polyodon spathula]
MSSGISFYLSPIFPSWFKYSAKTDHGSQVSLCSHPVPAEKKKADYYTMNMQHIPESTSNSTDNNHQQISRLFNNTSLTTQVYSSLYCSERLSEREITAETPNPLTNALCLVTSVSPLYLLFSEGSLNSLSRTQYKSKSSYKAYAAVPSNTLLLEQKAIDRELDNPVYSPLDDKIMSEIHAEVDIKHLNFYFVFLPSLSQDSPFNLFFQFSQISSPTQLRPMRRSHSAPISLQKLMDSDAPKNFTTLSRSAGRETKYASFHLLPSGFAEKQLTKPGVIRPLAVIPKVPEEREEYQPNPFRDYLEETSDAELQQVEFTLTMC